MGSAVVERLSRGPVGVTEKSGSGPLEVPFGVRGQTHPKVNYGVVKQGGDEGCEEETEPHQSPSAGSKVGVQTAHNVLDFSSDYLAPSGWPPLRAHLSASHISTWLQTT